jgi:hypothetical protein
MTTKDQKLIWEQYDKSRTVYYYPQTNDGVVFEVQIDPSGNFTPFDQSPEGEVIVVGTDLNGYRQEAPLGITLPRKSYLQRQSREFVAACIPYLEKITKSEPRRLEFQKQEDMRMKDYNSLSFKGD